MTAASEHAHVEVQPLQGVEAAGVAPAADDHGGQQERFATASGVTAVSSAGGRRPRARPIHGQRRENEDSGAALAARPERGGPLP